jgi:hypothetical protein
MFANLRKAGDYIIYATKDGRLCCEAIIAGRSYKAYGHDSAEAVEACDKLLAWAQV